MDEALVLVADKGIIPVQTLRQILIAAGLRFITRSVMPTIGGITLRVMVFYWQSGLE